MKHICLLAIIILLCSCGARKSSVNKAETKKKVKENVVTNTREEIIETVTRVIDTVIKIPGTVTETEKPLDDVLNGQPLVYEDGSILSETWYDSNTRVLKNKTTQKARDVTVHQKEVTQREIKRAFDEKRNAETTEDTKTKTKETNREQPFAWALWLVGIVVAAWLIILLWRRNRKG